MAVFHPQQADASVDAWREQWIAGAPCVLVLFYRAHLQAGNTQVFAELCSGLLAEGLNPLPIALLSLKDALCLQTLRELCAEHEVALILNTTAFSQSAMDDPGDHALAGRLVGRCRVGQHRAGHARQQREHLAPAGTSLERATLTTKSRHFLMAKLSNFVSERAASNGKFAGAATAGASLTLTVPFIVIVFGIAFSSLVVTVTVL